MGRVGGGVGHSLFVCEEGARCPAQPGASAVWGEGGMGEPRAAHSCRRVTSSFLSLFRAQGRGPRPQTPLSISTPRLSLRGVPPSAVLHSPPPPPAPPKCRAGRGAAVMRRRRWQVRHLPTTPTWRRAQVRVCFARAWGGQAWLDGLNRWLVRVEGVAGRGGARGEARRKAPAEERESGAGAAGLSPPPAPPPSPLATSHAFLSPSPSTHSLHPARLGRQHERGLRRSAAYSATHPRGGRPGGRVPRRRAWGREEWWR